MHLRNVHMDTKNTRRGVSLGIGNDGPVVFSEFTRSIEFHALVLYDRPLCQTRDLNYSLPLEIRAANSFHCTAED